MQIFKAQDYERFFGKEKPAGIQADFKQLDGSQIFRLAFLKNGRELKRVTKSELSYGKEQGFLSWAKTVGIQGDGTHVADDWYKVAEQIVNLKDGNVLMLTPNSEIIPLSERYVRPYKNSVAQRTFRKYGDLITLRDVKSRDKASKSYEPQLDIERKMNNLKIDAELIGVSWWGTLRSTGNRKITIDDILVGESYFAYSCSSLVKEEDMIKIKRYSNDVDSGGTFFITAPSLSEDALYKWDLSSVPLSSSDPNNAHLKYANVRDLTTSINTGGNIADSIHKRFKGRKTVFTPEDIGAYLTIMEDNRDVDVFPWPLFGKEGLRVYDILTNQLVKVFWKDRANGEFDYRRLNDSEVSFLFGKIIAWHSHAIGNHAYKNLCVPFFEGEMQRPFGKVKSDFVPYAITYRALEKQ